MIALFLKGGPLMWPLLLTSILTLAVVIERLLFTFQETIRRDQGMIDSIMENVEQGQIEAAIAKGEKSEDFVARILIYGLKHRQESLANALLRSANHELRRFNRGLSVLDTTITLAPLLGLLGTVTGMIHSFGLMANQELGAPTAITGGIAQALIATAFGLGIAILALIPFNYLTARMEETRMEIEDASNQLEILLNQLQDPPP